MSNDQKLKQIVRKIAKEYEPKKIYLFGSFAWGKPTKDSDYDLFVVKDTKEDRLNRQLKVRRLINGRLPIDVLVYTQKETQKRLELGDFFIDDIINKGKVLYEA